MYLSNFFVGALVKLFELFLLSIIF